MLRLQAELETSEQVQRDFVRLSQALQVWQVPAPPAAVTPGDVSWVMQGQSPARGVLFPLAGVVLSSELLLQTLKLCVSIFVVGSPARHTDLLRAIYHLPCPLPQAALPGPLSSLNLVSLRDGGRGYICPPRASALLTARRCAWSRSARQRVWSRCAASWTRRRSGTSGTSRTAEGQPHPRGDCLSPLQSQEA